MRGRKRFAGIAGILSLWLAGVLSPAWGQGFETVLHSDDRAFPEIGQDVRALKRDSVGHYYILARPANIIWVYDRDGKRIGQIPNANSSGAVIKYAVDIDLDPSDNLFVADRAANTVDIFRPEGSFVAAIPVMAPMSLAALSDGQFAVVTLRSRRLVTIMDIQGKRVLSFGDLSELGLDDSSQTLMDLGKISGDPAGHIYFAFTTLPDPLIRKYDRFGASAYSTSIQNRGFEVSPYQPDDRIQFSLNFMQMGLSNQFHGALTIGSSGRVQFGGGLGMGLAERMGGALMGPGGGGFGGPGGPGGMSTAGLSGQASFENGAFQFHLGLALTGGHPLSGAAPGSGSSAGGFASAGGSSGVAPGQGSLQGSILDFTSGGLTGGLAYQTGSSDVNSLGDFSSTQDAGMGGTIGNGTAGGMGLGGSGAGPMLGGIALQPAMFGGGQAFGFQSGQLGARGSLNTQSSEPVGMFGGGFNGPGREPGFGAPGRLGFNMSSVVGTVRINLDHDRDSSGKKPVITAIGVDPETEEVWIAIGSTILHFDKNGEEFGSYYVTTPNGNPLNPNAILVEPDRLLLASDPLGVFFLARPDHVSTQPLPSNISGQILPAENGP